MTARALFTCMYKQIGRPDAVGHIFPRIPWYKRSRRERFIFEAVIYATNQETFSQLQAI